MTLPLVSIAAINYNNADYVIETLNSINNQTYQHIEIVIVDDGSTDNCVEIIERWLKSCERPHKFIKHEKNKGVCSAYNSGVINSSGKYFCVIDTDDVLIEGKIANDIAILENTDDKVGGLYSDAYVMNATGLVEDKLFIAKHRSFTSVPQGNIYQELLQGNYIPCMTVVLKRSVFDTIGIYDESLIYEDYDMWLRVAEKFELVYSDFVSAKYRIRPGSLTHVIRNWIYSDIRIFLKHTGAALPVQRLENIACEAYSTNDADTMKHVKEMAAKIGNRYMFTAYFLSRFHVPFDHGREVLAKDDIRIHTSSIAELSDDKKGGAYIAYQLCATFRIESLIHIGRIVYESGYFPAVTMIAELYKRTGCQYFNAIRQLWKYKVAIPNGIIILDRIRDYCSVNVSDKYIRLCIYKDIFGAIKTGHSGVLRRNRHVAHFPKKS